MGVCSAQLSCSAVFAQIRKAMARSGSSSKRSSLYADLENLRSQFSSLDPNNTGYIGYEELKTLAQSESGLDEAMVPELLEKLDRDKDGKVTEMFKNLLESCLCHYNRYILMTCKHSLSRREKQLRDRS